MEMQDLTYWSQEGTEKMHVGIKGKDRTLCGQQLEGKLTETARPTWINEGEVIGDLYLDCRKCEKVAIKMLDL